MTTTTQANNDVIDVTQAIPVSDADKANAIVVSNNPALEIIDPNAFFGGDYSQEVAEAAAALGKIGDRISPSKEKGGFVFPDGTVEANLDCIILASADANLYYEKSYSDGDNNPPDCWAFNVNELLLKPSDNAPAPQSASCANCPHNQFKSASNGKGKKCQNTKSLVVMTLDNSLQLYRLKVSPTGLQGFKLYAANVLGKTRKPLFATPTRISLNPDVKYPSLLFKPLSPSEGAYTLALAQAVQQKLVEAKELALKEPELPEEEVGMVKPLGNSEPTTRNATRFAAKK